MHIIQSGVWPYPYNNMHKYVYLNTVANALAFTAMLSQLIISTADCPHQMAGVETVWELYTLTVMNSVYG